jgi:hypothetical protein
MHFLNKIIDTPLLEDPANNHMDVHRHFYRYSKGVFIGPALKLSLSSTKITLKGSHEYEDLITELVADSIEDPNKIINIKGNLVSGFEVENLVSKLNLRWNLKKSTGQTKNYKAEINDQVSTTDLINIIESFRPSSYLLLSFSLSADCKISTKKNIPQPSKKKVEDDDVDNRIQFCTGYVKNTEKNLENVLNKAVPDFISEIPKKWKSMTIFNTYRINEIELPQNVNNSTMLRILAIRKGRLIRTIELDDQNIEKQYSFVV